MSTRTTRLFGLALTVCSAMILTTGCPSLIPTVPIDVDLDDAGAGSFDVVAGTPVQRTAQLTGGGSSIDIGRGSVQLDPSVITYSPAGGPAKGLLNAQAVENCQDACDAAGIDSELCSSVCADGQISVRVWVGTLDEIETVCATGDEYGPFLVTLENGEPTAVDPSSVTLTDETLNLLNGGDFSICVEVIAPEDGNVLIDSLRFNVGL